MFTANGLIHTRQLSIDMCESAAPCCLPARCSQSRWGPCCVRAAIRLHTTTHVAFSLGEQVASVVCGVAGQSVLIEYTLHRANLTGRAGRYARRRRGGAPRSFQEDALFFLEFWIRACKWRERPLTLSVSGCVWKLAQECRAFVLFIPVNTDSPVETRAHFPGKTFRADHPKSPFLEIEHKNNEYARRPKS